LLPRVEMYLLQNHLMLIYLPVITVFSTYNDGDVVFAPYNGPIRGNMSPAATLYVNIRTLEGVLRCEKMLKCVHDYFVYLK